MSWQAIQQQDLPDWNRRLFAADAPLFQLPLWVEPFRGLHFVPRYLVYRKGGREKAFVSVLSIGMPGFRIGLVHRGPATLSEDPISSEALEALAQWASWRGFAFLRFSNSSAESLDLVARLPGARRENPFPFYSDLDEELIVDQQPDDDLMLASFQPVARRKIRKAEKVGYEVRAGDSEELFRSSWPLFVQLAARKGMSYRPLESYLALLENARPVQAARLYLASLRGRPVEAILIVRDSRVALYVSGALDVSALGGAESPSCLLHWRAMRDFYGMGQFSYNLGTPSGVVYQFKRQFHPRSVRLPANVTVVTSRPLFLAWKTMVLRLAVPLWPRIKRMVAR